MLLQVLKIGKELFKSLLTIATSIVTGTAIGISYLVFNGFKCLTDNMSANVGINVSKVNFTEVINAIEHHNGTVNLPISLQLSVSNTSECTNPLKIGGAIGAAFAGACLIFNYAHHCAKKKSRPPEGYEPAPDAPASRNSMSINA